MYYEKNSFRSSTQTFLFLSKMHFETREKSVVKLDSGKTGQGKIFCNLLERKDYVFNFDVVEFPFNFYLCPYCLEKLYYATRFNRGTLLNGIINVNVHTLHRVALNLSLLS